MFALEHPDQAHAVIAGHGCVGVQAEQAFSCPAQPLAPGLSRQLSLFQRTAKRRYFASSNPRARVPSGPNNPRIEAHQEGEPSF